MLLNNFFKILQQNAEPGSVKAVISFERTHPIFAGHFPGHPVVPGVTMIQALREIMEVQTSSKLGITTGDNLKFLSIINPEEHHEVEVVITYTKSERTYSLNATLLAGTVTFFKFKGTFQEL
jgi:3-hydroxyacyl-[acyl-carrier-protein] dehydratase